MARRTRGIGTTAVDGIRFTVGITAAGVVSSTLVAALLVPGRAARGRGTASVTAPGAAGADRPDPARCRCGHHAAVHEHFRPGTDCGMCGAAGCGRFRPARPGRFRIA